MSFISPLAFSSIQLKLLNLSKRSQPIMRKWKDIIYSLNPYCFFFIVESLFYTYLLLKSH